MKRRSPFLRDAFDALADLRMEFEDYRLMAYERASEVCRGRLLNARGMKARIDSYSLFIGNRTRAEAYASEELLEHWARYPRMTWEAFERQAYRNMGKAPGSE